MFVQDKIANYPKVGWIRVIITAVTNDVNCLPIIRVGAKRYIFSFFFFSIVPEIVHGVHGQTLFDV